MGAGHQTGQRTGLSRVTLVGDRRRVDLLLPSADPVGLLLPDILRLLDDQNSGPPGARHLVTADGAVLAPDTTLGEAAVPDGSVLRLVRADGAMPASAATGLDVRADGASPASEVTGLGVWADGVSPASEVTGLGVRADGALSAASAATGLDVRALRWRPVARRRTAGLAAFALAVAVGVLTRTGLGHAAAAAVLLGAGVVAALSGALAGRARNRALGITLMLTGGALGLIGAWTAADAYAWPGSGRLAAVAGALAVTMLLLGLCSPVGRGGLIGAGAVVVTTAVWEAVAAVEGDLTRLGAVLAIASVVALGALPRLALTAAGLTALDDHRSGGASVSRHEVETALAATHRQLSPATLVTAASATAAGLLIVTAATWWTVPLTSVLVVVLLSRARAFPLVAEVVALLAAAGVLLVRLTMVWIAHTDGSPYAPLAALAVAAVLPLVALSARRPPERLRARLRRLIDLAEAAGVIVLFPLAIGAFGGYALLLNAL
ncbi:EsaB/YukD family protein [Streptomyces sp. NPDC050610]|uniref:EsaB/YukD family protein n=1 Tax=Streptomyces sp. NPDC050610 TaxID=3157097 RepID=UPI00341EA7A3